MKSLAMFAFVGLVSIPFVGARVQDTRPAGDDRLARLEKEVAALKESCELQRFDRQLLAQRVDALATSLDSVVAHARSLARASTVLDKKLTEVDSLGFTYGMNFSSRQVLLAGFADFAQAFRATVPGRSDEATPEEK